MVVRQLKPRTLIRMDLLFLLLLSFYLLASNLTPYSVPYSYTGLAHILPVPLGDIKTVCE